MSFDCWNYYLCRIIVDGLLRGMAHDLTLIAIPIESTGLAFRSASF
jgi:hypothetical protein